MLILEGIYRINDLADFIYKYILINNMYGGLISLSILGIRTLYLCEVRPTWILESRNDCMSFGEIMFIPTGSTCVSKRSLKAVHVFPNGH